MSNNTRVLLINPPQRYFEKSADFDVYFPIGLISIASYIKNICNIKIMDCLIEDFSIKKNKDQYIYGTPSKNIENKIKEFRPNIVGISAPFSTQKESVREIISTCRKLDKNMIIIVGGPDATIRYEEILKENDCDFCILGEGEKTFFELIRRYQTHKNLKNIKGVAYKTNKRVKYNPNELIENLDELGLLDYDLLDMNKYLNNKRLYKARNHTSKKSISIITSRGCPYNCVFCSVKTHMGKKFRSQSPDMVLKHIKMCVEKYGIRSFHFEDDNIAFDRRRFEQILDNIIDSDLKISWNVPNGIHVNSLDHRILKKIKKSGCEELTIAIESGNQRVLNNIIRKNLSLKKVLEVVKECKKLRIRLKAFYVIGFPGESKEDIQTTMKFAIKLLREYEVIPSMMFATPIYGTELYNIALRKQLINKKFTDEELSNATQIYGEPLIKSEEYSKEWLKKEANKYIKILRRELFVYSIKHPLYAIKKLEKQTKVIKEIFKRRN